jgi:hypothetical protein
MIPMNPMITSVSLSYPGKRMHLIECGGSQNGNEVREMTKPHDINKLIILLTPLFQGLTCIWHGQPLKL